MVDEHEVRLTTDKPPTILPTAPADVVAALDRATAAPPDDRLDAVATVAARWPRYLEAWAMLAEIAGSLGRYVDQYAYARVGYHRGLDALRAAGWRGSEHVRWTDASNRGFLRSLEELRRASGSIGELDEEERCALFLRQLDPDWPPAAGTLGAPDRSGGGRGEGRSPT